jgi:hypothetical protein
VRVRVFAAEIVRVVRRDERDVELSLKAEKRLVNLFFVLEALVLNFEKEVALAEDVLVLLGDGLGFFIAAGDELFTQLATQAA